MKNHNSIFIIIVLVLLMSEHSFGQNFLHGYSPDIFPPDTVVSVGGKDVIAMWFIAPATGCIDSIFWLMGDTISALDSTGYFRVHKSNIRQGRGPGYDYPSPPIRWGYWKNTRDTDQGLAAFYQDATDTQWISTISGLIPSFQPWGEDLFGLGGFPVILRPNFGNYFEMWQWNPCFSRGDAIVISCRVNNGEFNSGYPTQFKASKTSDSLSRAWIFYEHDSGWHAIGKLNFNIWFSMHGDAEIITGWKTYSKGWNLVSVPKRVSDFRKTVLFPDAISHAFGYNDGYSTFDTLQIGRGYWLKFDSTRSIYFDGQVTYEESTDVKAGWNVIGTPSMTLSTEYVHSYPPGIISGGFYRYNRGYTVTDMLYAGEGYWVKVAQDGKIVLSATRPTMRSNE
ncbi:MAG: hypothetical protein HY960_01280 [Ignavibacteriae bacterium]|nr:hypothetical protein [Ignavibacteriota bacterium]